MSDRITFKCDACEQPVVIDETNPPKAEDIITCIKCGRVFGRFDAVQAAIIEAGKATLDNMLKDTVEKLQDTGWKRG